MTISSIETSMIKWERQDANYPIFFGGATRQDFFFLILAWQISVYVAGFPCKAFSKLRGMTGWLQDKEAMQFISCAKTIKTVRPAVSWYVV